MPGVEYFFNSSEKSEVTAPAPVFDSLSPMPSIDAFTEPQRRGVYYNPRLDPKNYLEGPLSPNPSTRLRQMLARPGIVVGISSPSKRTRSNLESSLKGCSRYMRRYQRTMCSRSRLYLHVSKVWISNRNV